MPEEEARWIFQQLLVAVDYCQRLGVANRDIKVIIHLLLRRNMCAVHSSCACYTILTTWPPCAEV